MVREFIYFSKSARTTGNFGDDLMKAGRIDIACQVVIMAFFVSKQIRRNVKLHLIFNGQPDPPKHIEMFPGGKVLNEDSIGEDSDRDISKKDVAGLIKKLLYKYRPGLKHEVMSGYFIEKKGFVDIVREMLESNREVFILDKKGDDLREVAIGADPVFVLGDHDGIPSQEMKRLNKLGLKKISVGNVMYFASQTMTIVHNELDRRGVE